MESPSEYLCTFHFSGLPKHMTITKSGDCCVDSTIKIEVPNDLFSNHLLRTFSTMQPGGFNFPKTFFDENNDVYQRNVEGFLALLKSCMLNHSGLNTSARNANTQDDLSGKSTPHDHGSEDKSK